MQDQERFIAPGLGVVIVLATFILGVPLVYQLLLGLLGLAAAGTYFAPQRVQVETRIAIAALGLIILLIVTSTAFWLALLSFAAIGALQIPNRHHLQRNPATIAWLSALLKRAQARRAGQGAADDGVEGAEVAAAGDGASGTSITAGIGAALPGFVRMNVAGIGGAVVGAVALMSIFLDWSSAEARVFGETVAQGFTLREGAADVGFPLLNTFFYVLLALGVASIATIVLPRALAAIVAVAGLAATVASYLYIFVKFNEAAQEAGVNAVAFPSIGPVVAVGCYLAMIALQLIPAANRSGGRT